MAIKLFRTRSFASLGELLQWMDAVGDQIVVVNVAGTGPYIVTFAEATVSQWRVRKTPGIDDIKTDSARPAD